MNEASQITEDPRQRARRRWLLILGVVVAAVFVLYGLYWLAFARHFATTDDAYIGGDIVAITSREPGTVLAIHADNTQTVEPGQLLVDLDPVKADVAMQAAEADLARTVRAVRTQFLKVDETRAQLASAQVSLTQAENDYKRRREAGSAVSHEEVQHARDAITVAQARVKESESGLAQALASVEGTNVADNPEVLAAMARLRQASIVLAHMHLYAPVSGVIAQRSAQLGQQIAPGTPLMAVVPLEDLWVDANFKEVQLKNMRIGQPVTVRADLYGGGVTYHGKVVGLGAGSGSAFALLPPQNASGNWIKIVQRVPVRIALDSEELRSHPLRVGLSAKVTVDTRDTSGSAAGSASRLREMKSAPVDDGTEAANRRIAEILAQNGH